MVGARAHCGDDPLKRVRGFWGAPYPPQRTAPTLGSGPSCSPSCAQRCSGFPDAASGVSIRGAAWARKGTHGTHDELATELLDVARLGRQLSEAERVLVAHGAGQRARFAKQSSARTNHDRDKDVAERSSLEVLGHVTRSTLV